MKCRKFFFIIFCRKCCFCVPLKIGFAFLLTIQMIALTPFTVCVRSRYSLQWAIILMVLLVIGTIITMWGFVIRKPVYLPTGVSLTFGNVVFHFSMLDQYYANVQTSKKQEIIDKMFLVISIIGVVSYFYLMFILHCAFTKLIQQIKEENPNVRI